MVTRCVCFGRTFKDLKKIARRFDIITLEDLQRRVRFGENCRRCLPYVRLMLRTDQTEFDPFENGGEEAAG